MHSSVNQPFSSLHDAVSATNYNKVRGRVEEVISDRQKRHRSGDFSHGFSLRTGFDHTRPGAFIDAYGQGSFNKKPRGLDSPTAENSWKNTEEEEFDWEDMSRTLTHGNASTNLRDQHCVNSLHSIPPYLGYPQQLPQQANLGYPQQGSACNIRNNPIRSFHPLPPFHNDALPFPPGPPHYSLIPPNPQGPVVNHPISVNISGILNSLVAQGILPQAKQPSQQEDNIGLEFDLVRLKVRHESAIRGLYERLPRQCSSCSLRFKTQDEHRKHMDWHVTTNRISKNRKHNPSRKWFVSCSMWLIGAESLGIVDAAPRFLPAETTVVEKKDDEEEMVVPADENQTKCALFRERFQDFYSHETDEWLYREATYLNIHKGPIVHAKCRSNRAVIN